jgi:hypothetical protein
MEININGQSSLSRNEIHAALSRNVRPSWEMVRVRVNKTLKNKDWENPGPSKA